MKGYGDTMPGQLTRGCGYLVSGQKSNGILMKIICFTVVSDDKMKSVFIASY